MEPNKKSSSHDREVTAYLKPDVHSFLDRYMLGKSGISKSSVINDALREFKLKVEDKKKY